MISFVFYTDFGIRKWAAGTAIGPVILIRPKYRGDEGLLAHEQTHVWQFWRTFGLMPLLYWLSHSYRFQAEVEAYRVQLRYAPKQALRFARFISDKYGLDVSVETALTALQREPTRC